MVKIPGLVARQISRRVQRPAQIIENGQKLRRQISDLFKKSVSSFALDAFTIIVEISLPPVQSRFQLIAFVLELSDLQPKFGNLAAAVSFAVFFAVTVIFDFGNDGFGGRLFFRLFVFGKLRLQKIGNNFQYHYKSPVPVSFQGHIPHALLNVVLL